MLNSVRDNEKFNIESIQMIYSLPLNTFTLINDKNNNIYLIKIKNAINKVVDKKSEDFKSYIAKENSNSKNSILKSYDLFLNNKYNVVVNQKTINRVKNLFQ